MNRLKDLRLLDIKMEEINIKPVEMMKEDPGKEMIEFNPCSVMDKKEKSKMYNAMYYLKNKEYWKEEVVCECGLTYKRASKNKHSKGKAHLRRMINQEKDLPKIEMKKECEIHLEGFEKIVDCITLKVGNQTFKYKIL